MEIRPKLKLQLTPIDKGIEILGFLILILHWIWVVVTFTKLPDIIPTHFNARGEVDGFGSKVSILTLPVIATIIYIVLTIINKYPHNFNYLVKITEYNALRQYTNVTKMVRVLKVVVVAVFFLITFETTQVSAEKTNELSVWFLPLILGMTFLPLIYFIAKSFREK